MKKCPRCKEKTLRTKGDVLRQVGSKDADKLLHIGVPPSVDVWSLVSDRCINTKCGYFR